MTSRDLKSFVAKSPLSASDGFEVYLTIILFALSSPECPLLSSTSSGGRASHASLISRVICVVVVPIVLKPYSSELMLPTSPYPILFGAVAETVLAALSDSNTISQSQSESSSTSFREGYAGEGLSILLLTCPNTMISLYSLSLTVGKVLPLTFVCYASPHLKDSGADDAVGYLYLHSITPVLLKFIIRDVVKTCSYIRTFIQTPVGMSIDRCLRVHSDQRNDIMMREICCRSM